MIRDRGGGEALVFENSMWFDRGAPFWYFIVGNFNIIYGILCSYHDVVMKLIFLCDQCFQQIAQIEEPCKD